MVLKTVIFPAKVSLLHFHIAVTFIIFFTAVEKFNSRTMSELYEKCRPKIVMLSDTRLMHFKSATVTWVPLAFRAVRSHTSFVKF